jgi:predicted phage terminase large subunit-like protein
MPTAFTVPLPDGSQWRAPTLASADRERVRWGGFEAFCKMAIPHVPGVKGSPLWNWHMSEVCAHFQALYEDRCSELVVNVPPGHIKSTIKSVLGPAWIWTLDPAYQFMIATYDDTLSRRFAEYTIAVCRSPWYVERWGEILRPVTNQQEFYTYKSGLRFGSTLKGKGVGRHANMYMLDDPNKPLTAESAVDGKLGAELKQTNDAIQSSVLTRARPGEPLRLVVAQQRVHEEDASGFLLESLSSTRGFVHLMLPHKFEPERRCVTPFGGDRRQRAGELLWPIQEGAAEKVVRLKGGWHGTIARNMYQQDPRGGSDRVFHASTFKRFDPKRRPLARCFSCLSIDPTFTDSARSDYVAMEVWGFDDGDFLCFYSENVRRTFNETLGAIIELRRAWNVDNILIEQAANGAAIIDTLQPLIPGIVVCEPRGKKVMRARAASHHFTAGNVYFAEGDGCEWYEDKARNLVRFPGGRHDDDVDTTSQAVLWLASQYALDESFVEASDAWRNERQSLGARLNDPLGLLR